MVIIMIISWTWKRIRQVVSPSQCQASSDRISSSFPLLLGIRYRVRNLETLEPDQRIHLQSLSIITRGWTRWNGDLPQAEARVLLRWLEAWMGWGSRFWLKGGVRRVCLEDLVDFLGVATVTIWFQSILRMMKKAKGAVEIGYVNFLGCPGASWTYHKRFLVVESEFERGRS